MCNFIIRPIKSYATVDVGDVRTLHLDGDLDVSLKTIPRGTAVEVTNVSSTGVHGKTTVNDTEYSVLIPLSVFIHTFTANPDEVEKARKEEHKTMGYDPNKKKDSKEQK